MDKYLIFLVVYVVMLAFSAIAFRLLIRK